MRGKYQVDFTLDSEIDYGNSVNLDALERIIRKALHIEFDKSKLKYPEGVQVKLKEKIMQTYKVTAKVTTLATMHIDAHSAAEARDIAMEMDGGDFSSEEDGGSWDIDSVEVIKA